MKLSILQKFDTLIHTYIIPTDVHKYIHNTTTSAVPLYIHNTTDTHIHNIIPLMFTHIYIIPTDIHSHIDNTTDVHSYIYK